MVVRNSTSATPASCLASSVPLTPALLSSFISSFFSSGFSLPTMSGSPGETSREKAGSIVYVQALC